MPPFQALTVACSLSTSMLFLLHGILMCANQSYQSPFFSGLDALTAPSVALYVSSWYGCKYATQFVLPRTFWTFMHGKPLPEDAFIMWKAANFVAFMAGILPLAFEPSWRLFAFMLFLWPLDLFLTHVPITLLDSRPRLYMIVAPMHASFALLPILFIDPTTL